MLRITTLYDNYLHAAIPGLRKDRGFSCVVEYDDKVVLFDTGADGRVLLDNAERLRVDLGKVQVVLLSHDHGDHTGGLAALLSVNPHLLVYVGRSFSETVEDLVRSRGGGLVEVDEAMGLVPRVFTTGERGGELKEQSLVVDSEARLVVITGCAHAGIVEIARFARNEFGSDVHLVMGGFHLEGVAEEQVRAVANELKTLGVSKVAPSHCTGDEAISVFRETFGDGFISGGVGKAIEL